MYARIMIPERDVGEKPSLVVDPELAEILAELSRRELTFHWPEFGTTRADLEDMLAEAFCEVGASGRRYSRAATLKTLEKRSATPNDVVWKTFDFQCQKLGPNVFLLTHTLIQDDVRRTRRATIWQRSSDGWKIVYHQGTVVQDE